MTPRQVYSSHDHHDMLSMRVHALSNQKKKYSSTKTLFHMAKKYIIKIFMQMQVGLLKHDWSYGPYKKKWKVLTQTVYGSNNSSESCDLFFVSLSIFTSVAMAPL